MAWVTILNYFAWYVFVMFNVMWILVLLQNRGSFYRKMPKLKALPPVSIIIPAYNEGKTIAKTIRSVLKLDYPKRLIQTIVVNDCSKDNTREVVEDFGKEVTLLNNKKNMGKAGSLNRAIKIAKGKFIACMDADSTVNASALKTMIPHFADPKVGCVTPALRVKRKSGFLEKVQHAEYLLNIFLRKILAFMDAVFVTPGAFSMFRKDVLLKAGGFDEDNLTEDMEIALKIHKLGYKIENELKAITYTYCPNTVHGLFRQRIRWYRGGLQNYFKYRHMFFNRKYGNLGVFLLPFNIMAISAIIILFFTLFWNYANTTFDYVRKANFISWDILPMINTVDFELAMTNVLTTALIFGLAGLVMGSYVLYTSFRVSNQSVSSSKAGYLLYLLVFPAAMTVFWTLAFIYELLKFERKW